MAELRNDGALVAPQAAPAAGKLLAVVGGWAGLAQAGTRVTMMREAAVVCWKAAVVEPVLVQTSLGTFQSRTWAPDTASYHAGLLTKQSPPHYYYIIM